ncbi:MAG: amino acid adenylation domain-containing protein [Rhabdochlamydiaceae bacterium]
MVFGGCKKEKSIDKNREKFAELNKSFVQLFRDQSANTPNDIAIVADDKLMTYDELDKKSDNFANYLKTIGVKKENLVGICSSINNNFIVCMLAIIKVGAVYFPLDPSYPSDRLEFMLKDGSPSVILIENQYIHLFNNKKFIKINEKLFTYDCDGESIYESNSLSLDNLAYVIYTSGSTGAPKGIMISHRSLSNIALSHSPYYPSNTKMLVCGGVCFDASLLVIFHALINNEPLYLFNYNPKNNIDALLEFIESNSIGYMICVPSQYLQLLKMNHELPFLKCVSLTGENLPHSLCELHAKLAPNALLYNEYGPSECAIGTTIAKIYDPEDRIVRKVTIGKALPNTQVYILDKNLNKVPEGVKGEICIGGIGLARGYLNNKALTAEKFVTMQFSEEKPIRLYRTGDFGRFLSNGELEFLGRMDHRIQICGDWVDLGEIEYHVSGCTDVRESAVVTKHNLQKEEQLVVYITSSKKSAKNSLLLHLKNLLPQHMIPDHIVQIDKFPFTPNGKIDRDALVLL